MPKRLTLLSLAALLLVAAFAYEPRTSKPKQRLVEPFDDAFYAQVPLSQRSTAMGATDPSWSPQGREIAFSLFGSLWVMPAAGGQARQITAALGYDAGASWSPDGRSLAFIRGEHPIMGVQIGATGKLMVINIQSGDERNLAPEMQFVGVPAWTTDSAALVANQVERQEPTLYLIPLGEEKPRRLTAPSYSRISTTQQRGSGWFTSWYPVAVHPSGTDIVFGADRDGTPQLWRMPLRDGLVITSKLTRYDEDDQADIQDLTWETPTSLLYSNNLHSDRTNYDLWRWKSGTPPSVERLTSTITDEFSPRISPDGKTVLFVSNYLGNLDLFTTTPGLSPARHLRIDGLQFKRPSARLKISLRNEAGEAVGARISVRAGDGKFYGPTGALYRYHRGMGENAGFFYAAGDFELTAPAGPFQIAAYRGLEYEPVTITADIPADTERDLEVRFQRFTRWQGNGWWSGEDHIHANYAGPYYQRPEDAFAMIEGEDLNVANMMVANAEGTRPYDREFFEGKPHELSNNRRILYWNEEYRNRIVYGHMALLNLLSLTDPIYTSFEGTPHPYDYPSNTMTARDAREKGALVAYVHPIVGPTRDPFDFPVSAKELPVTAALGLVDVIDIYPWGPISVEIWYKLLNCGFRIAPGAGSDTFSNWRYLNRVPGMSRAYVQSSGELRYADWIAGLRQGRSFVTSGPLLTLEANGSKPGDTLKSGPGEPISLQVNGTAEARLPLQKLELVMNGEVVASADGNGARQLTLAWNQPVRESGWIALRATGSPDPINLGETTEAHTAALYFEVGGKPMQPRPADAALFVDWIDRLWDLVELRNNFATEAQKQKVKDLVMQAREFYAKHAKAEP